MKSFRLLLIALLLSSLGLKAQTYCTDVNNYPDSKNTSSTSSFTLRMGYEELAAQTYYYSGPGVISQVRVYGELTTGLIVPVRVIVYSVDEDGRPASVLKSVSANWNLLDNIRGYKDISMGSLYMDENFALGFGFGSAAPSTARFELGMNGNNEGKGQDLSSLSGTSTGNNWTSAKSNFQIDGDFYIMPQMVNYITANFSASSCASVNSAITFTNTSEFTRDSMFNRIALKNYKGSNHFYKWDFGDNSAVSYDANPSHAYASAGKYTVTLTATVDGWNNTCTNVYTMDVSVGLGVSVEASTKPACNGSSNGSIKVKATGGASSYQYSIDLVTWQSEPTFNNLAAGSYNIYVKDALGCTKFISYTLEQPAAINLASAGMTAATCGGSNGAILISGKGGTGSLKYSLDNSNWQTSGSFTSLAAGNYTVYIKDSMGCELSFIIGVKNAAGATIKLNSFNNISCSGTKDGSISVGSTGGTGTPQYSIDGTNYQTSGTFSALGAGTYVLSVKDGAGCIDNMNVTLTEPTAITFSTSVSNASCNGSSTGKIAVLNAIGGTGTLRYSIDGTHFQTSNLFSGLQAKSYTIYVKDAVGCSKTATVTVNQPSTVSATVTVSNATCHSADNGSITITGTGGTAPYVYSLNGVNYVSAGYFSGLAAGNYTINVLDAKGCYYSVVKTITEPSQITATITTTNSSCGNSNGKIMVTAGGGSGTGYSYSINGTTFNTTGIFNNLTDSNYSVVVRDGAGCMNVFAAVVTNSDGPQITNISHTNVTCFDGSDGSITVNSTNGGTGTLTYSIDGYKWQTSNKFSNVAPGDYVVRVKDNVGCTGSITTTISAPSQIKASLSITDSKCANSYTGKIVVNAAGGIGTFAYSIDGYNYQSSNVFSSLRAGNYLLRVRDAGNCTAYQAFTINEPAPVQFVYVNTSDVSCHNAKNGLILASATGGTGAISYSINGTTYSSLGSFADLAGGSYTVYAKDANGCISSQNVEIHEPAELKLTSTVSDVSCANGNNGVIDITVTGGTGPYFYTWSNQAYTEDQFNLAAGTYSVTVWDVNGCSLNRTFNIEQPSEPLTVNGVVKNTTGNDGSIDITVSGGVAPYKYAWSNNATTEDLTGLSAGTYMVQITDHNLCQTSVSFTVTNTSGIEKQIGTAKKILVYPNPVNNMLTLSSEGAAIDNITILSSLGQVVYTQVVKSEKSQIDVTTLNPGIYIVQYVIDGKIGHTRIEVAR